MRPTREELRERWCSRCDKCGELADVVHETVCSFCEETDGQMTDGQMTDGYEVVTLCAGCYNQSIKDN